MAECVIKLPDVGEGVAEAELVEWHVKVGDLVREDTLIAAVMTDKATVEIPSPVDGEILWLGAEIGDTVAVGSPIVRLKVAGDAAVDEVVAGDGLEKVADTAPEQSATTDAALPNSSPQGKQERPAAAPTDDAGDETASPSPSRTAGGVAFGVRKGTVVAPRAEGEKPIASPAVRLRARETGIDLRQMYGTGPAGRITHADLDGVASGGLRAAAATAPAHADTVEEIKLVGLRRKIAEKMTLSASRIPHITYVEEIDVTAVEALRAAMNTDKRADRPRLTFLPFLMRAMVRALGEQPGLNAHFDDAAGVTRRFGAIHIGVATQTAAGLVVAVVRHAEARDLRDCARELARLADAARAGTATRDDLSGSTITITSLGAMGGVATTPIINHPEVAIVGVNKMMVRPVWDGNQFHPRTMMNLSSSFDHRVVDGWDAAVFVQRIRTLIETPALMFLEE